MAVKTLTVSGTVREILAAEPNLPADQVILRAQRKGVTAPVARIREAVHNVRSEMRKAAAKAAKAAPAPAPAAARTTPPEPTPAPEVPAAVVEPAPAPVPTPAGPDLATILANVALVNRVAGISGVDAARAVAEAVRACGGVDLFLQHLDLVAGIRAAAPTAG